MQELDEIQRNSIVEAIAEEMKEPLREITVGDQVVVPWHTHIARALRGATR